MTALETSIERALLWRERLALRDTNALRLVNGDGDGMRDFVADRFGEFVVLQPYEASWRASLPAIASVFSRRLALRGVLVKGREKDRAGEPLAVVLGEPMPDDHAVRERGLAYAATFGKNGKPGLYLDHRETRAEVRVLARDRRVLNLFSFAGAFSVAAAAGGARSVTSVDATKGCAEAACLNFEQNGLATDPHEFLIGDVFEYLAEARAGAFDLVVVDPPSFAQTKSSVLGGAKQLDALYAAAVRPLARGGILVACSNHAQTEPKAFAQLVARALRRVDRTMRSIGTRGLPADHPTHPSRPRSRYLKVLVGVVD